MKKIRGDLPQWLMGEDGLERSIALLKRLMGGRLANGSGLILLLLARRGELHPAALLAACGMSDRAFWSSLKALNEQGLIYRRTTAKKKIFYSITNEGRRYINERE